MAALRQLAGDDHAERMLGDERRHAPHLRAETTQYGRCFFVINLRNAESIKRAFERAAYAVERQIAFGQNFAARLKFAERKLDHALIISRVRLIMFRFVLEECRLAHV